MSVRQPGGVFAGWFRGARRRAAWLFVAALVFGAASGAPVWEVGAAGEEPSTDTVVALLELVVEADADAARDCLRVLADKIQSGELAGRRLEQLRPRLRQLLAPALQGEPSEPLYFDAHRLAASWGEEPSRKVIRSVLTDDRQDAARRLAALETLVAAEDTGVLPAVDRLLSSGLEAEGKEDGQGKGEDDKALAFRGSVLAALGGLRQLEVADLVLRHYDRLAPSLRPKAMELLTQRTEWSKRLLDAIGRGDVPQDALHRNQVARLLASRDEELVKLVRAKWGTVRTERNPEREKVLARMRETLGSASGDPFRGRLVFQRVCGQCHRIHGEGQQVGPDITANGRSSFEQLLSNVFDPSLVIGSAYQARTVITLDGRVLTGLVAEDNEQRVVLKLQGGKTEAIAREDIDEMATSRLSLMPEGLEGQLKPEELADLFAFLVLDGPPEDPAARLIPGAPASLVGGTSGGDAPAPPAPSR